MRKRSFTLRCGAVQVGAVGFEVANGLGMIWNGFWFPSGPGGWGSILPLFSSRGYSLLQTMMMMMMMMMISFTLTPHLNGDMQATSTIYIPVRTCRLSHFLTTNLEPRHGLPWPNCRFHC
jgi:hypothetical protein